MPSSSDDHLRRMPQITYQQIETIRAYLPRSASKNYPLFVSPRTRSCCAPPALYDPMFTTYFGSSFHSSVISKRHNSMSIQPLHYFDRGMCSQYNQVEAPVTMTQESYKVSTRPFALPRGVNTSGIRFGELKYTMHP